MSKDKIMKRLIEIYNNAYNEGIWIREFGKLDNCKRGNYMAAAGSIKELEKIEKKAGKEIDVSTLGLGDIVNISLPGTGKTREEACLAAIKAYKDFEKNKTTGLELYSTFEERGYKIEVYIPHHINDKIHLGFIIKAYKEDKLVEEMKVPMDYVPVFGVDVADVVNLEEKVAGLMEKLP